ncbi:MAG TPA: DNA polymerase ligase N-terminal domain-containing protein, partial [Gemmatimonadaceae bacterium]|nr:DNA polymerase ligase N-terminal domain-containing protein [Gemmatimonadaceae bacterium]
MATTSRGSKSPRSQLAEYRRKRDFTKTAEPSGHKGAPAAGRLRFVIQKHAASHLHFDLRLELDGVMKSWAVPKGPSTDPSVKRLAMQVEDHPIEYNTFEGTIPKGEYGGGTVMLWDRGTYVATAASSDDDEEEVLREGYQKGDLKITFFGERMRGSWALVRMKYNRDGSSSSEKPQWLFIKHRDEFASDEDIVADNMTSVTTGRTMDEITTGRSKVWRSNRSDDVTKSKSASKSKSANSTRSDGKSIGSDVAHLAKQLEPMYASIGTTIPGEGWTFEPKYDGVRVLAFVSLDGATLITRNGKDKSEQFPEIVEALEKLAAKKKKP